mgnify:CR=1 FL=1
MSVGSRRQLSNRRKGRGIALSGDAHYRHKDRDVEQAAGDHQWWREVCEVLGPQWRIVGFTYRRNALLAQKGGSSVYETSHEVHGALAERLHELWEVSKGAYLGWPK